MLKSTAYHKCNVDHITYLELKIGASCKDNVFMQQCELILIQRKTKRQC